ncbi:MAG: hypothetical protein JSS82_14080 [Bacteroidetes bacterium]|nr:hypothetical protein [Bacteroidota bacterium]
MIPNPFRVQHYTLKEVITPVAIATVLTTNDYFDGVMTLHRSFLMNTDEGFRALVDFVVLYTDNVSTIFIHQLQLNGCKVRRVPYINNVYDDHTRFDGSFAKLHIWNMTEYRQVAYLDADCLILKTPRLLFECDDFCVRQNTPQNGYTFRFNSGVMTVVPNPHIFRQLTATLASRILRSADSADQGFLNSYFFYYCYEIIDGTESDQYLATTLQKWIVDRKTEYSFVHYDFPPVTDPGNHRCKLLPYGYNYDVNAHGMYLNNPLVSMFAKEKPVILQYTGAFKPWDCGDNVDSKCKTYTQELYDRIQKV